MQHRYAGDIGDYVKLALLRALAPGRKLGVAWYLYPDEDHNRDGRHVQYLDDPNRWRYLDPDLFDALRALPERTVGALERAAGLSATFFPRPVFDPKVPRDYRSWVRSEWFVGALEELSEADIIFADPDNGITDDAQHRRGRADFGKKIPLSEVLALAGETRTAIVYHHNTRRAGGHAAEIAYICDRLGTGTFALRAAARSPRTFFFVRATEGVREGAKFFQDRWRNHGVTFHNAAV